MNENFFAPAFDRSRTGGERKEDDIDLMSAKTFADYLRKKYTYCREKLKLHDWVHLFGDVLTLNIAVGYYLTVCYGADGKILSAHCSKGSDKMVNELSVDYESYLNDLVNKVIIKSKLTNRDVIKIIDIMIKNNKESEVIRKVDENLFAPAFDRSRTGEERKEDKLSYEEEAYVQKLMDEFCTDDTRMMDWETEYTLDDFLDYAKLNAEDDGYNWERIKKYIQNNWTTGIQICDYVNPEKDDEDEDGEEHVDECDAVAPNGGLTFGDVSGMGPILFPGECGEKGSGDLPMPSGKVYQQVAPFGKFIKAKKNKKKTKKFDKKDEPCAEYTNPPIYNHVDDFRDYVDRTYDIVDKK